MGVNIILPTEKTWTVYEVPPTDPNLKTGDSSNWGLTYFKDKDIYIDGDLKPEHKIEVLRHEITHAVIFETQFTEVKKYTEEDVCDLVGTYGKIICELADKVMNELQRKIKDSTD